MSANGMLDPSLLDKLKSLDDRLELELDDDDHAVLFNARRRIMYLERELEKTRPYPEFTRWGDIRPRIGRQFAVYFPDSLYPACGLRHSSEDIGGIDICFAGHIAHSSFPPDCAQWFYLPGPPDWEEIHEKDQADFERRMEAGELDPKTRD